MNKPVIYKVFKEFEKRWKDLENIITSDAYWRVRLICTKVQAHSSSESPLEYNQDQVSLTNQGWLWLS